MTMVQRYLGTFDKYIMRMMAMDFWMLADQCGMDKNVHQSKYDHERRDDRLWFYMYCDMNVISIAMYLFIQILWIINFTNAEPKN